MKYNNEFSTIDTPEKAYFLGLFYADGCVNLTVSVFLTEEDGYVLKNLQEKFLFFNFRFEKRKGTTKSGFILSKQNKSLVEDILKHGAPRRKSYENKEQLSIPNIKKELYRSFVRGFFDGDGSVFTHKTRPNGAIVEICCVSYNFITQLKTILEDSDIECKLYNKQPNKKDRKQVIYRLYITKSSEIIKFKEFIYSDNINLFIIRKKQRLDNAQLLFDSRKKDVTKLDRNFVCPYCNSNYVILGQTREMKWGIAQRLKCKSCNKWHTIPYQENIARFPRTGKMKR